MIRKVLPALCLLASLFSVGQDQPTRVIDVHVHAYPADWVKNVLGPLATESDKLPDPPNPITGNAPVLPRTSSFAWRCWRRCAATTS